MNAAQPNARVTDDRLTRVVADGASALALTLQDEQIERLVAYIRLLERWNTTYNLTSIRDPLDMATQHIVDCLAVIHPMRSRMGDNTRRVLDVGSGAGLPGVVVAVVQPDIEVVCVDSVGKKAAFIRQAAASLHLDNLVARHSRVQDLHDTAGFPLIASRAFASLAAFVDATREILARDGWWMAMKGRTPTEELLELPEGVTFHVERLEVPGLAAERCIVWGRVNPTGNVGAGFLGERASH